MKDFSWELIHVSYERGKGRVETLLNKDITSPIPRIGDSLFHEEVNGQMLVMNVVWNFTSKGDSAQVFVGDDPLQCSFKEAFREGWEAGWDSHRSKAQTLGNISVTYDNDDFEPDWESSLTNSKLEER